jgi:ABC-type Fe3+-siderophore transport system permease subunit
MLGIILIGALLCLSGVSLYIMIRNPEKYAEVLGAAGSGYPLNRLL